MHTNTKAADADYHHIAVTPVSGSAGAMIEGVDLAKPLAEAVIAEIRRAFLDHCVVLFRGQDLDPASQIAFGSIFGEVIPHPLYRSAMIEGYPEILVIEHKAGEYFNGRNDIWHSDVSFNEEPALGSILHCRACWEGFGDTMFANQYLAYETLSEPMKAMLSTLEATHDASLLARRNNEAANNVPITEVPEAVRHPVVRTHPETGRKALFVNEAFTTGIVGMPENEASELLSFLYRHAVEPRFVYRHRWRVGDVVMFDNRCLLHYVVLDYPAEMHRRMHRVTAKGDRPY